MLRSPPKPPVRRSCSRSKGFWKYHDKLFANQQAIKRPDLEKYAEELGLDMPKFKAALDSHKHKDFIEQDAAVGNKAGVGGTPGFVINGYFVSGAQPFQAFDKVIKMALTGLSSVVAAA
jgi:predicted DsbA family dithiol-disulfide isomerase